MLIGAHLATVTVTLIVLMPGIALLVRRIHRVQVQLFPQYEKEKSQLGLNLPRAVKKQPKHWQFPPDEP